MNTESDANKSHLVNRQSEPPQDTKEGIRNLFFDHIYACHSQQVDRPGPSRCRSETVLHDQNVKRIDPAASRLDAVKEEKVSLVAYQPQLLANLSENLNSCRNENKQLKNLLLMHLDLIQQQSDQLLGKEKQLVTIKEENDMLKKKLVQMDHKRNIPTVMENPPPLIQLSISHGSTPPPIRPPQQVKINNFGEFLLDADADLSQSYISITQSDKDSSEYLEDMNLSTAIMVSSEVPTLGLGSTKQNDFIVTSYIRDLPTPTESVVDSDEFKNMVTGNEAPMNQTYINENSTIESFMSQTSSGQALINVSSTSQDFSENTSNIQGLEIEVSNKQAFMNRRSPDQTFPTGTCTSQSFINEAAYSQHNTSSVSEPFINLQSNTQLQTNRPQRRVSARRASIAIESAFTSETSPNLASAKRTYTRRASTSRASNKRSSTGRITARRTSAGRTFTARSSSTRVSHGHTKDLPNAVSKIQDTNWPLPDGNPINVEQSLASPTSTVQSSTSTTATNRLGSNQRSSKIYRSRSARTATADSDTFNDSFENRTFDHEFSNKKRPKMIHTYMSSTDGIHTSVVRNEPCYKVPSTSSGPTLPYPDPYEITNDPEAMQDYTPIPKLTLHRSQQSGIVTIGSSPPKYQNLKKIRELQLQHELEKRQIDLYNESVISQNPTENKISLTVTKKVYTEFKPEPKEELNDYDQFSYLSPDDDNDYDEEVDQGNQNEMEEVFFDGFDESENLSPKGEVEEETSEEEFDKFNNLKKLSPRNEEQKKEVEAELDDLDKLVSLSPLMDEESYSFVAAEWDADGNNTQNEEQDDSEQQNEESSQATWSETRETSCGDFSYNENVMTLSSNIDDYFIPESEVMGDILAAPSLDFHNEMVHSYDDQLVDFPIQDDNFSNLQTSTRRAPPRAASMYVPSIEPEFEYDAQFEAPPRLSGKDQVGTARKISPVTSTAMPMSNQAQMNNVLNSFPPTLEVHPLGDSLPPTKNGRRSQTKRPRAQTPRTRKKPTKVKKPSTAKRTGRHGSKEKDLLNEESAPTLPPMMTKEAYYMAPSTVDASWCPSGDENIDTEEFHKTSISSLVEVPRWREILYTSIDCIDGTENLDDAVFRKRHYKHEMNEKRRQRWDMQRIREQQHIERLLRRQNDDWVAVSNMQNRYKHNVIPKEVNQTPYTFWPKLSDIQFIEIVDEIPVSAFGEIIPDLMESDFLLPPTLTAKHLRKEIAKIKKQQREQERRQKLKKSNKTQSDLAATPLQPSKNNNEETPPTYISTNIMLPSNKSYELKPGSSTLEQWYHSEDVTTTPTLVSLETGPNEDYKEAEFTITSENQSTPGKSSKKKGKKSKRIPWTRDKRKNKRNVNKQRDESMNQLKDIGQEDVSYNMLHLDNDNQLHLHTDNEEYQSKPPFLQIPDSDKSIENNTLEGQGISLNNNREKEYEEVINITSETEYQADPGDVVLKQSIKRCRAKIINSPDVVDKGEPQRKKNKTPISKKKKKLLLSNNTNSAKCIPQNNSTALKMRIETLRYDTIPEEIRDTENNTKAEHVYIIKSSPLASTTLLQQQLLKPLSSEELLKNITTSEASQANPFVNKVSMLRQPPKPAITPEEFKQKILLYSESERKPKTKLPVLPKQLQKQLQEKKLLRNKELEKKTNVFPHESSDKSFESQKYPAGQDSVVKSTFNIETQNVVGKINLGDKQQQSSFPQLRELPKTSPPSKLDSHVTSFDSSTQVQSPNNALPRQKIRKGPLLPTPTPQYANTMLQQPSLDTTQRMHHQYAEINDIHHWTNPQLRRNHLTLGGQSPPETAHNQTHIFQQVPLTQLQMQTRPLRLPCNETVPHTGQMRPGQHEVLQPFLPLPPPTFLMGSVPRPHQPPRPQQGVCKSNQQNRFTWQNLRHPKR